MSPKLTSLGQAPRLQLGTTQLLIGLPQGVPLCQKPLEGQDARHYSKQI